MSDWQFWGCAMLCLFHWPSTDINTLQILALFNLRATQAIAVLPASQPGIATEGHRPEGREFCLCVSWCTTLIPILQRWRRLCSHNVHYILRHDNLSIYGNLCYEMLLFNVYAQDWHTASALCKQRNNMVRKVNISAACIADPKAESKAPVAARPIKMWQTLSVGVCHCRRCTQMFPGPACKIDQHALLEFPYIPLPLLNLWTWTFVTFCSILFRHFLPSPVIVGPDAVIHLCHLEKGCQSSTPEARWLGQRWAWIICPDAWW